MGLLSWILFGLVAGAIARLLVPGRQSIGCLATLAVGIAGALVGGFVGEAIFGEEIEVGWDLRPFLLAVAGAVGLLLLLQAIAGRRRFYRDTAPDSPPRNGTSAASSSCGRSSIRW